MATEDDGVRWLISNQFLEVGLNIYGMQLAWGNSKDCRAEASKSFVSHLPTVLLPNAMENSDHDVCSVCLEEFNHSRTKECSLKQVPCGHVFHENCITTWLSNNSSCPICRYHINLG